MARYKVVDTNPQFLSVDLARQLLPGMFAYSQGIVRPRAIERVCPRARDVHGTVRHDWN